MTSARKTMRLPPNARKRKKNGASGSHGRMGADMGRSRLSACLLLLIFAGVLLLVFWPASIPSKNSFIHGMVVGADGPVSEARVRFQAEEAFTLTDSAGQFQLHAGHSAPGRITA